MNNLHVHPGDPMPSLEITIGLSPFSTQYGSCYWQRRTTCPPGRQAICTRPTRTECQSVLAIQSRVRRLASLFLQPLPPVPALPVLSHHMEGRRKLTPRILFIDRLSHSNAFPSTRTRRGRDGGILRRCRYVYRCGLSLCPKGSATSNRACTGPAVTPSIWHGTPCRLPRWPSRKRPGTLSALGQWGFPQPACKPQPRNHLLEGRSKRET
jgi:hypothetical protein